MQESNQATYRKISEHKEDRNKKNRKSSEHKKDSNKKTGKAMKTRKGVHEEATKQRTQLPYTPIPQSRDKIAGYLKSNKLIEFLR